MFGEIASVIKDSIKLAARIEDISNQVSELSIQLREENRAIRSELRDVDNRVVRIEALIEYSEKFSPKKQLEEK